MKRTILAVGLILCASVLFGQQTNAANNLGRDTAQQRLVEISVSRFEDPGFWRVYMPIDSGVITHRRLPGAPADKQPIPEEEELGIVEADDFVLGVKAEFFRRNNTHIVVAPVRPLNVPGIVKTLSVWVVGRNLNHRVSVMIRDHFGNTAVLQMGRLNFSGWRQMTTAIPPTIVQRDPHFLNRSGIQVVGFLIEPALMETYGSFYVYFDDLRGVTDLFAEESRDPDDMVDSW
ncbi:MAG: flagellar filament protein FlaA [Spirochaetaceae bacterium]|nr:MAG: flagellar filament protein FlaA [Spirochaetaceae bacterium]